MKITGKTDRRYARGVNVLGLSFSGSLPLASRVAAFHLCRTTGLLGGRGTVYLHECGAPRSGFEQTGSPELSISEQKGGKLTRGGYTRLSFL